MTGSQESVGKNKKERINIDGLVLRGDMKRQMWGMFLEEKKREIFIQFGFIIYVN